MGNIDRNLITNKLLEARKQLMLLSYEMEDESLGASVAGILDKKYAQTERSVKDLEDQYLDAIYDIPVSRCPFTGDIISLNIDINDLNGLWWDAENPVRLFNEHKSTLIAYTGSIHLDGDIPKSPFMLLPGPEVPWVCPRLLNLDTVKAVISKIMIGSYKAYVVAYYAESEVYEGINNWGINHYVTINEDGNVEVDNMTYDAEDYDYDIANWIKRGKLKWIAPFDMTLTLHDEIENCPFIGLEGRKYPVVIINGEIENAIIEVPDMEEVPKRKYCSNCGNQVEEEMRFCDQCGQKLI